MSSPELPLRIPDDLSTPELYNAFIHAENQADVIHKAVVEEVKALTHDSLLIQTAEMAGYVDVSLFDVVCGSRFGIYGSVPSFYSSLDAVHDLESELIAKDLVHLWIKSIMILLDFEERPSLDILKDRSASMKWLAQKEVKRLHMSALERCQAYLATMKMFHKIVDTGPHEASHE